jgi:hypothetical protein
MIVMKGWLTGDGKGERYSWGYSQELAGERKASVIGI